MSTVLKSTQSHAAQTLPPLRNGDHLDQKTFHARYEAMPEECRAELIGGVVFLSYRTMHEHAVLHAEVVGWLGHYAVATPGVELMSSGTVILDEENEPQPDAVLRIHEDFGGASRVEEGYVVGSPELHVEVAYSSEAIDLFNKHDEYARTGVREYVVVLIREEAVRCFRLEEGGYVETPIAEDDVWRSREFPGLWLHTQALVRRQGKILLETLQEGLDSPEHAEFLGRLRRAKAE